MANAPRITAYVLTYNEARQIRPVLESIRWADELIVVDSFSTDGTIEVAKSFGANIVSSKFIGFGNLRNLALDAAQNDWILSIDADERCTPELGAEVRREAGSPRYEAYHVPRKSHFLGRWIRSSGWYPDYRQPQFFHRKHLRYRDDLVHEGYDLQGRLGYLKEHAMQYPWDTLDTAINKIQRYSTLMAQRQHKEGKRSSLVKLVGSPPAMFIRNYLIKKGLRDGIHGFLLAGLYSYYTFLKYAKIWELEHPSPGSNNPNPSLSPTSQPR